LGDVLGEKGPVPNTRIIAKNWRRKKGFKLVVLDNLGKPVPYFCSTHYTFAHECKVEGAIRFAMDVAPSVLSKHVFRIIESKQATRQVLGRDRNGSGDYFLLHDNGGRKTNKRYLVGVVKYLSEKRILFVQHNLDYGTGYTNYTFFNR
jgi:hypothetical protein